MTNEEMERDASAIDEIMRKYSGNNGAHFGFIIGTDGVGRFFSGGRATLVGASVANGIIRFAENSPDLNTRAFIGAIATTARIMLDVEENRKVN